MVFTDFQEATLGQLQKILSDEECELIYKCAAESELERRAKEKGLPINYGAWYLEIFYRRENGGHFI